MGWACHLREPVSTATRRDGQPDIEIGPAPGNPDIPEMEMTLVDEPHRGLVGLGEPPTISTAAAMANAVANAAGVRVRRLPLSPDAILQALERRTPGGTL